MAGKSEPGRAGSYPNAVKCQGSPGRPFCLPISPKLTVRAKNAVIKESMFYGKENFQSLKTSLKIQILPEGAEQYLALWW